ncbi:hypothetical protein [Xylanimonas oleitrophica]|nr:hypothetical protein [Xylanimonas oleitrophica]
MQFLDVNNVQDVTVLDQWSAAIEEWARADDAVDWRLPTLEQQSHESAA